MKTINPAFVVDAVSIITGELSALTAINKAVRASWQALAIGMADTADIESLNSWQGEVRKHLPDNAALQGFTVSIRRHLLPALNDARNADGKDALFYWACQGNKVGSLFTCRPKEAKPQSNKKQITAKGKGQGQLRHADASDTAASIKADTAAMAQALAKDAAPAKRLEYWLRDGILTVAECRAILERFEAQAAKAAKKAAAAAAKKAAAAAIKTGRQKAAAAAPAGAMAKAMAAALEANERKAANKKAAVKIEAKMVANMAAGG